MSIILLSSKYLTRTMYIDVYSLAYTPDLVVEFCSQILLSKNRNVELGSINGNMCIILTQRIRVRVSKHCLGLELD